MASGLAGIIEPDTRRLNCLSIIAFLAFDINVGIPTRIGTVTDGRHVEVILHSLALCVVVVTTIQSVVINSGDRLDN